MAGLDTYRTRRDFTRTTEPSGSTPKPRRRGTAAAAGGGHFVVHKHAARRLHYDLRLEHDGVLWSWAVTRGPSLDPGEKRLAVHVEDHPLDYASFEGTIPEGEYGAGAVIVWDEGRWTPQDDPVAGMKKGHIAFTLEGSKLGGAWHLVRLPPRRGERTDNWLLIKVDDAAARPAGDILDEAPASVRSGLTIADVQAGKTPRKAAAPAGTSTAVPDVPPSSAARAAPRRKTASKPACPGNGDGPDDPLPDFVEPCLATLRSTAPEGDDWLHEVKFDGYRVQARIERGAVRLLTRSGLDWTTKFGADLVGALQALPCRSALIDGELVALREDGVSSFSALQAALSAGDTHHLVYFAFDLLHLDGRDLRGEPLLARRDALEDLLGRAGPSPFLRFSEHFEEQGSVILDHSCRMGLEGVVSKRAGAPYRSGRGQDWIKSKCVQQQEFVIVGYLPSQAKGRGLASLILAYRDGDSLVGAGNVGTGFDARSAVALQKRLDAMRVDAPPLGGRAAQQKGAVWVRPELVAEVEFRAWTDSGSIRHASFRGLREDKPAAEVVAEIPQDVPPPASGKPRRKTSASVPTSGAKIAAPPVATIRLTSPDKVLWPDVGLTKQHLLDYYALVWPLIREHVVRRPLSLVRAPNGIEGQRFFQKHAMPGMPEAIRRMPDPQDGEDLLWIEDFDGLAALVQLGVVEIHVWGCTIDALEQPDQIVFDLDPDPGVALPAVRAAAAELRVRLSELDMPSKLKLSGGKGYHVVVPLKPQAGWAAVKGFAHDFARAMEQSAPDRYTATLSKKARKGRIFIDYLRNGRGATAIAPWSSRARPGGPVSAPVDWTDLPRRAPADITIPGILGNGAPADAWSGWRRLARPLAYTPR